MNDALPKTDVGEVIEPKANTEASANVDSELDARTPNGKLKSRSER